MKVDTNLKGIEMLYYNKHFEGFCELLSKQSYVMSISVISIWQTVPCTFLSHVLSIPCTFLSLNVCPLYIPLTRNGCPLYIPIPIPLTCNVTECSFFTGLQSSPKMLKI